MQNNNVRLWPIAGLLLCLLAIGCQSKPNTKPSLPTKPISLNEVADSLDMSVAKVRTLVMVVHSEAHDEGSQGRQAVAEVIWTRRLKLSQSWSDLFNKRQFNGIGTPRFHDQYCHQCELAFLQASTGSILNWRGVFFWNPKLAKCTPKHSGLLAMIGRHQFATSKLLQ